MQKNTNNKHGHIPYASRIQLGIAVGLACLNIVVSALLCDLTEIPPAAISVIAILVYLAEITALGAHIASRSKIAPDRSVHSLMGEEGSAVFKTTAKPVVTFNTVGKVLWYNDAMREVLAPDVNFIGKDISYTLDTECPTDSLSGFGLSLAGRKYEAEGFRISERGDGLYMLVLTDVTELSLTKERYRDERTAVAYIAIDNVEDVLQYVHDKLGDAVSSVDEKLKAWAESLNAVIKSYDNDKYVMMLDSKSLDKCIENRFEILDTIRESRVNDGASVTVSIGISKTGLTLHDRELAAREAIDMALQRGGDQVVYKTESSVEFYGGRTKSVYKRSNIRSRTFTSELLSMMVRADNVIIMGHRYGDFDSFGASIGVARLAMLCGAKANIAVDFRDRNLLPCIELMQDSELYSQTFVDNAEGLDLVGPDTLVVLVDLNAPQRAQFADIAAKVSNIVVIDHHRTMDSIPEAVKLHYIEPSASSACELVTEMIQNAVASQNITKSEADMLLAGILLDTKQFTRNTGTRTFGAAQYLRGAGADPTDVYALFKTEPSELSKEARFHTAITIYNGNIAISACDGDNDDSYRIIASKAADKMLTLRGIDAAFTLVKIGEQIHISARSAGGKVNVQLILEKLGGGGHFDVAGAQVLSDSVGSVLESLKASIDDYLDV